MSILILRIVLMVLTLLFVVPFFTRGNVALRSGGFLGGLMTLFLLALVNSAGWFVFAIMGGALLNLLTLGFFGVLVNGLVLMLAGWMMPDTLQVNGYGWAVLGGLVMTVCSYGIQLFLH